VPDALAVWTVGHSTLSLPELEGRIEPHGITAIADVRRFPGSRRHPQYNREALEAALPRAGIRYEGFPDLGGRRVPRPDSTNLGWRHPAFRGYADYMETPEFRLGIARLLALAREERVAVMCAEAQWVQCHRRLIADFLTAAGHRVLHIGSRRSAILHRIAPPAVLSGDALTYPGEPSLGL